MYQRSKYTYAAWIKQNFGIDPLVHVNTPGNYPNLATISCFSAAGATAGSVITLVACRFRTRSRSYFTDSLKGPFELTKLSAQLSVVMAARSNSSITDPVKSKKVAASYQNKGTFQTARNIVRNRGIAGLYSGFSLHLRESIP